MRKVLNILQSAATAFPEVNEDSVYTCVGHPLKSDITNILQWLLNSDFATTYNSMYGLIFSLVVNGKTVLHKLYHTILNPMKTKNSVCYFSKKYILLYKFFVD